MTGKQNRKYRNENLENKAEQYQKVSTALYYQEKLQGFYKDYEIKEMQDWLENSVSMDNIPYYRG